MRRPAGCTFVRPGWHVCPWWHFCSTLVPGNWQPSAGPKPRRGCCTRVASGFRVPSPDSLPHGLEGDGRGWQPIWVDRGRSEEIGANLRRSGPIRGDRRQSKAIRRWGATAAQTCDAVPVSVPKGGFHCRFSLHLRVAGLPLILRDVLISYRIRSRRPTISFSSTRTRRQDKNGKKPIRHAPRSRSG